MAAPDLVPRDFSATRPDALWLADFTYVRTWEGWAYLAVVLDVYTRRIVGWQLAPHMRQSLVTDAFEMALAARQEHDGELVAHSHNGSQYTPYEYTERLKRAGIAPSRGRTGTALDNAMAESVISTLKRELVSRYRWPTRRDLELALVTYIGCYNARRGTAHSSERATGGRGGKRRCRCSSSTINRPQETWFPSNSADAEPGACHLESPKRDWGWPATKLAQVNPDAVMLHQVKCYHGEHHKGRLIATLDQLWWLERGFAGSAEQPLSYDWVVEVSKRSNLAKFATGPGVLGVDARRGLLTIGADLFQIHASEVHEFGLFLRQMQQALGRLEEQGPVLETEAVASSPLRSATPTALLKELAELRDLGIVTVDEFQAKKAELLSKEW